MPLLQDGQAPFTLLQQRVRHWVRHAVAVSSKATVTRTPSVTEGHIRSGGHSHY